MKLNKLFAINVILIIVFSQIVFAQTASGGAVPELYVSEEEIKATAIETLPKSYTKEAMPVDNRFEFEERKGFMPDFGPSYEGFNKEEMLFGRLYPFIDEAMSTGEIQQHCDESEKIADIVISKVNAKIGGISNVCKEIEEQERECKERIEKDCSYMGHPDLSYAIDELDKLEMLSNSCPVNKDAIIKACILRSKEHMQDRLELIEQNCKYQWEDYGSRDQQNCERMSSENICNEDEYVDDCMDKFGVKPEDFECQPFLVHKPSCDYGHLETEYDHKGCEIGYRCIEEDCPSEWDPVCGHNGATYQNKCHAERAGVSYSFGECKTCPITNEEVERRVNDCKSENGNPQRVYENDCVIDVQCEIITPQCPLSDEEIERKINDCTSQNGVHEKVYRNDCVTEVRCDIPVQCALTDEEVEKQANECVSQNGVVDRVYENDCVVKVNCIIEEPDTIPTGAAVTGNVVLETYDDYVNECKRNWQYQKENCEQIQKQCKGKDGFIGDCIQREKENYERELSRVDRQCEIDSMSQIRHMERQCVRMEADMQRCIDDGKRRCEMEQGLGIKCREEINEESFRNFVIKETEKRCKFMPFFEKKDFSEYKEMEVVLAVLDTVSDEEISKLEGVVGNLHKKVELDGKIIFAGTINPNEFGEIKQFNFIVDAKLIAPESSEVAKERKEEIISRINPIEVVQKLLELRDTGVSSEYKYLIEGEASDILDVSDDLDELSKTEESKGIGYKIKLFLGFAKGIEDDEIEKLELSRQRLETSIASLSKLADEIPDDIAKSILKAQVEELERQKQDMDDLIEQKEKKSKGLLRLFGLFG
ncbi:Kazal-type serine protease inhibitor [Chloroflexota bacterium]